MQLKCKRFTCPQQDSRVSSCLGLLVSCFLAVVVLECREIFGMLNNDTTTSIEGRRIIFQYNDTIPASSVIPVAFNITEENVLENLSIQASCANFKCNFMIITHESYLDFLKESTPSLSFLRKKAMEIQVLNITNTNEHVIFISQPKSYVFLSVNADSENSTMLTIRGEMKYSYGRGFVEFLKYYWYIIIFGAVVIVFCGIAIAIIANRVKGRDLFNGMTSYTKKDKSMRCLLTDEDMKEEIDFKTVTSMSSLQGEEMKSYASDSDNSMNGYTN